MNPFLRPVASQQLGVFSAEQAMTAGLSDDEVRSRVRSGEWHALRRGIYIASERLDDLKKDANAFHRVLAIAGWLALKPGAFMSHVSGAALHRLVLLNSPGGVVHATRPGGPPRSYRGLRVHEMDVPLTQRTHVHVPVVTIARTILDCAVELSFTAAVVTTEAALFDQRVSSDELWDAYPALPRRARRGVERVLHFSSSKSESPGESLSRLVFVEQGLPEPQQQVQFGDDRGLIGRVDFAWRERRVIAEFDGRLKYGEGDVVFREKVREDRLRDLGFEVVRITWDDVTTRSDAVAERVREAFSRAERRRLPA